MRQIVEGQTEKVIEAFTLMQNKEDVNEFKNVFKGKFQKDWDEIQDALKDEESEGELGAPEEFLEKMYQENYEKMDD